MAQRGLFACADRAMDDEPIFELLARDPAFGRLVRAWADERHAAVRAGDRPYEDMNQVREARMIAEDGERWRRDHLYAWRRHHPLPAPSRPVPLTRPDESPRVTAGGAGIDVGRSENEVDFPRMKV
jgi:hypothetical protein